MILKFLVWWRLWGCCCQLQQLWCRHFGRCLEIELMWAFVSLGWCGIRRSRARRGNIRSSFWDYRRIIFYFLWIRQLMISGFCQKDYDVFEGLATHQDQRWAQGALDSWIFLYHLGEVGMRFGRSASCWDPCQLHGNIIRAVGWWGNLLWCDPHE